MKEVDIETLERMFPNGFALLYIAKDGNPHLTISNPLGDEIFTELVENIQNEINGEQGEIN